VTTEDGNGNPFDRRLALTVDSGFRVSTFDLAWGFGVGVSLRDCEVSHTIGHIQPTHIKFHIVFYNDV
jgi:hypothetical protein